MKKIKKLLPILLFFCFAFSAHSQSAERITSILNAKQATYGQVCYMGAVAIGLIEPEDSYEEAITALQAKGFIKKAKKAKKVLKTSDPVDIGTVAELCTGIWTIRDSIMCEIIPIKHYKLRQLKALGIIPEKFDIKMVPTGAELIGIITACAEQYPIPQQNSVVEN